MSLIKITPRKSSDPYTGSGDPVPASVTIGPVLMDISAGGEPTQQPGTPGGGVTPNLGTTPVDMTVSSSMSISALPLITRQQVNVSVSVSMNMVANDVGIVSPASIQLSPAFMAMSVDTFGIETTIGVDPISLSISVPGVGVVTTTESGLTSLAIDENNFQLTEI